MAGEITPRRATSSAVSTATSAGEGADIGGLSFTVPSLHYSDLPDDFPVGNALDTYTGPGTAVTRHAGGQPPARPRRGPGTALDRPGTAPTTGGGEPPAPSKEPFTYLASQLPKPFRLKDGTVVQRRTATLVHPDRIIFTTAERPLTKRDNGTYAPNGDWALVQRRTWVAPTKAERATGFVPVDPVVDHAHPARGDGKPEQDPHSSEAERFPEGADAIRYLPAGVRRSLYARVPDPVMFDGKVVQLVDNLERHVVVVRSAGPTAVVAVGVLPHQGTTWDTTMLTYTFPDPPTVEGRP